MRCRTLATLSVLAVAASTVLSAGHRQGSLPQPVRDEVLRLNEMADQIAREGNVREANELRARARALLADAAARMERVEKRLADKDIRDDVLAFALASRRKEQLVHEVFGYLFALNLINGLNLSQEQMRTILDCLRRKQELCRDAEWERTLALYLLVKEGLEKDARLTDETRDLFFCAEGRFLELERDEERRERGIEALRAEIEACLTEEQKEVVRAFVPCHIPPDDQNDPVRAGQADTPSHQLNVLRDARRVPARELDEWFEGAVMPHVRGRVRTFGEHPDPTLRLDEAAERRRVRAVIEKARRISDVEFEVSKAKLVAELALDPDPPQPPVDEAGFRRRIREFLLDERFIPLLEKRLAARGAEPGPQ